MHILLVDDDPDLVTILAEFIRLRRPDWRVEVAADGAHALAILRALPIDLLVSDIQMPNMDGMALLEEVRKDPRLAKLPLIFATGLADRGQMREGMASGADDYLTKPFTGEELIAAIEGRLRRFERVEVAEDDARVLRAELARSLTGREREVLGLVGLGLVTKEIAARLGLCPTTVSVHRANIMRKLDLHTSAALAALAARAQLA
jgi:DNA-binding NarL/FixJ family response regulator